MSPSRINVRSIFLEARFLGVNDAHLGNITSHLVVKTSLICLASEWHSNHHSKKVAYPGLAKLCQKTFQLNEEDRKKYNLNSEPLTLHVFEIFLR